MRRRLFGGTVPAIPKEEIRDDDYIWLSATRQHDVAEQLGCKLLHVDPALVFGRGCAGGPMIFVSRADFRLLVALLRCADEHRSLWFYKIALRSNHKAIRAARKAPFQP